MAPTGTRRSTVESLFQGSAFLSGTERKELSCVQQAVYFYGQIQQQNVNLEAYGITAKEAQQAHKAAQELLQLKEVWADKKSLAENSTEEKRKAQAALYQWVVDFRTIARMAFRNQPQTLEAFGIRVRTKV